MIKVNIKNNIIVITGHAGYDDFGKDIVCAGVSAIVTGGLNALTNENKNKISCVIKDGYVNVDVLDINDDKLQLIMDVIIIQLKTIEESYKKYIKINEM